jgi:hypothetical protein
MMLCYVAGYRDAITVALELGAAQEVFVPLAGVHYGSTGACSHPKFTSNLPPQVRVRTRSAWPDLSAALTARSAFYPCRNAPGNSRRPESNSAGRPRSRCRSSSRFSRLPAGCPCPLGRRWAMPRHSTATHGRDAREAARRNGLALWAPPVLK